MADIEDLPERWERIKQVIENKILIAIYNTSLFGFSVGIAGNVYSSIITQNIEK